MKVASRHIQNAMIDHFLCQLFLRILGSTLSWPAELCSSEPGLCWLYYMSYNIYLVPTKNDIWTKSCYFRRIDIWVCLEIGYSQSWRLILIVLLKHCHNWGITMFKHPKLDMCWSNIPLYPLWKSNKKWNPIKFMESNPPVRSGKLTVCYGKSPF